MTSMQGIFRAMLAAAALLQTIVGSAPLAGHSEPERPCPLRNPKAQEARGHR
jgi:hypothetical protein